MPKLKEGDAARLEVPDGARDIQVFDEELPGFGLRKFASGKASYFVKYSIGRQQRRLTLGPAIRGNCAEMRKRAELALARARVGQDTAKEKKVAADKGTLTLGDLVPRYLKDREPKLRPRYFAEIKRQLERDYSALHARALETVTRRDVVTVVDTMATSQGEVAADRARTALSGLYAWAIERGYAESNPTLKIAPRAEKGGRTRVLSEAELVEVWTACRDDDYGRLVRLLLLTGQRRTEFGGLLWSEAQIEKRQVELPEARTKNKRKHLVPLSSQALALLPDRREGRELVFGRGETGFTGWTLAKAELDRRIAAAREAAGLKPMAPWVLHDLRRSFVTHISETGIAQPHVVEAIVNHVSGHKAGVAGVYNHAAYLVEKRQALEMWGAHVAALIEGRTSKVIPLRAAE
jgi:integrase